jgi:hypothetical protein
MIQLIPSRGFAIVMRSRGPRGLEPVTSDSDQSNRISMKRYAVADVCPNPAPAIRRALETGPFVSRARFGRTTLYRRGMRGTS